MAKPALHADTSVLAKTVFGTRSERAAASRALSRGSVTTSRYATEELRCTFLRDAVLLHNLVAEEETVDEALLRVAGYRPERRRGRAVAVYAITFDAEGNALEKERLLDRLALLIEGDLMDKVLSHVAGGSVVDGTGCSHSGSDPVREQAAYVFKPRCQKADPPHCRVVDFHTQHAERWRALADGPPALYAIHSRFRQVARSVAKHPEEGRGENCFGVLADAVIALEAPDAAAVCSVNAKDFGPLCAVIGKKFIDARPKKRSQSTT